MGGSPQPQRPMTRTYLLAFPALYAGLMAHGAAQQFPLGERTPLTFQLTKTRQPTPGDFNGDGSIDVLVSSAETAGLSLLRGDGQGAFADPLRVTGFENIVIDFATADLDGDGDLDVAALLGEGADGPQRLVRLSNDGTGSFTEETIQENTVLFQSLEVADLNGDGAADLVINRLIGGAYELVYLAAQGAGYTSTPFFLADSNSADFTIADVDGDGILDLATDSGPQAGLLYTRGLGGGAFAPGVPIQAAGGTTIQYPSRLLDIDGDGDTDCLQLTGMAMRYFDGLGGGSFASPVIIGGNSFVSATRILDVEGDGDLDVVNVQLFGPPPFFMSETKAYLQSSPGTFGPGVATTANIDPEGALADIDGNGRADMISGGGTTDVPLVWQLNNLSAASGFFDTRDFLSPSPFFTVFRVAPGDLDGDGDEDVALSTGGDGTVGWIENLAPAVTAPPEVLFTTSMGAGNLHVLDVDGDLDADIVVESPTSAALSEFWLNDGNLSFSRASSLTAIGAGIVLNFHVEDMDGDGDADVLISRFTGGFGDQEAQLYTNNGGAASFTPSLAMDSAIRAVDVRVGEFNGDSIRDLVITRFIGLAQRYRLEIYPGLGNGAFGAAMMAPGLARSRRVSVGDFDSDGLTDLFVWDTQDGIVLRRAMGGGTFDLPVQLLDEPVSVNTAAVLPIDFDADGDTDILYPASAFAFNLPKIAEQLAGGVMRDGFPISGAAIFTSSAPQFGDLDGDGDKELLTSGFGTANAYENFGIVNVGSSFCTGPPSFRATLTAVGTEVLADNRITLVAAGIQPNVFGIAVGSQTFGPQVPVGTQGLLCLTGPIGRYDGPDCRI